MSDLTARLRSWHYSPRQIADCERAADALEALQAENERLYGIAVMYELAIRERDRERALADQLAEALRVCATDAERSTPAHADDLRWRMSTAQPMVRSALAAWEATRHEGKP